MESKIYSVVKYGDMVGIVLTSEALFAQPILNSKVLCKYFTKKQCKKLIAEIYD